ncbi:MAG TPA: CvpA family protein [Patescibacteria group bacterium]|nr:CvpA family protein [Patescibacteria group bacterium]
MFQDYIDFIKRLLSFIPLHLFDYLLFIIMLFYVFEDAAFGLIPAGIGFISTISAFFVGLAIYHPVSQIMVNELHLPKGISDAIGFLLVTAFAFILISAILSYLRKKYLSFVVPPTLDRIGGAIFGFLSFFFIASFVVALMLSFPVSAVIKDAIRNSVSGRFLVARTQGVEGYVRQIFGGAIDDTINFLTVKPDSNESLVLNFKDSNAKVDQKSEQEMLRLLNIQRQKSGLTSLVADPDLTDLARAHAKDMLARGYFSHYTPEGLSPFDRMAQYEIRYQYAGENLAFAPETELAMDGLMKSPGHRANILSPNFHKVGIGVLDAGIYGKMFVQEFTD